ncbi:MAG: hypothetical protein IKJ65_02215 [Clostridia bacterium]|nr:hypothetical protein [Clostridia bacterium]
MFSEKTGTNICSILANVISYTGVIANVILRLLGTICACGTGYICYAGGGFLNIIAGMAVYFAATVLGLLIKSITRLISYKIAPEKYNQLQNTEETFCAQ